MKCLAFIVKCRRAHFRCIEYWTGSFDGGNSVSFPTMTWVIDLTSGPHNHFRSLILAFRALALNYCVCDLTNLDSLEFQGQRLMALIYYYASITLNQLTLHLCGNQHWKKQFPKLCYELFIWFNCLLVHTTDIYIYLSWVQGPIGVFAVR